MASAQVDVAHVEDLTKSSEETTLGGSCNTEGSAKAPPAPPQNIASPYDEEPEDVIELGKEDELDDEEDKKPHIIEDDEDEDDEDDGDEEQATKSAVRANDFSEEDEADDDV